MTTLYSLTQLIKDIAQTQPNVRTVFEGNIYDSLNTNKSVKYDAVCLTQGTHRETEDTYIYNFNFMWVSRLQDNLEENRLQAQSLGIQVISNILKILEDKYNIEIGEHTYQTWTQQFLDETAGVLCNVELTVYKDWNCADMYGDIPDITITDNGKYNIGGHGVVVEVESEEQHNQQKQVSITDNGTRIVTYDDGYTGLEAITINTNVPQTGSTINNQNKNITITNNGSQTVTFDAGYTGLGVVGINTNVPDRYQEGKNDGVAEQKAKLTSLSVTENGTYTKEDGYNQITVNVQSSENRLNDFMLDKVTSLTASDLAGVTVIPENFAYFKRNLTSVDLSNITEIKNSGFAGCGGLTTVDLSSVRIIGSSGFQACSNLTSVGILQNIQSIAASAFYGCNKLTGNFVIGPGFTANTYTSSVWQGCSGITSFTFLGTPNNIGYNTTYANTTWFDGCSSVQYFDFTHCTSVPNLLGSTTFTVLTQDYEIRVPQALYNQWIAATNWSAAGVVEHIVAV